MTGLSNASQRLRPKVAILELYRHFEVLRPLLDQIDAQRYEVHIYVPSDFKDQYAGPQKGHFQWHLFPNTPLASTWFSEMREMAQFDLVLVLTAVSHFNLFNRVLSGSKYFYLVHNATPTFFRSQINFQHASLRDMLGGLKYLLRSHGLRSLLQNAAGIGFLDDQVVTNLPRAIIARYLIRPAPPIVYRSKWTPPTRSSDGDEFLRVVVPGTLKRRGRDYGTLVQAISLLPEQITTHIEIIFLGVAAGEYATQILDSLHKMACEVIHFSKPLTLQEFDQYFKSAHLCICPFRKWYRLGLHRDEFGKQSISGVMNDLIFYGTPALVSPFHPFPQALHEQILRYHSTAELSAQIAEFFKLGKPPMAGSSAVYERLARADKLNNWIQRRIDE